MRDGTPIIIGRNTLSSCPCCSWPYPSREKWGKSPTTVSTHTGRWYPPSNRNVGPLVDWCPTSTGAVHKSVTCSCVSMLVQLNKCVLLCVVLICKEGISGDGCLTSSILFKYERSRGHLFVQN